MYVSSGLLIVYKQSIKSNTIFLQMTIPHFSISKIHYGKLYFKYALALLFSSPLLFYSTVTDLAKLRGKSTSIPRFTANQ